MAYTDDVSRFRRGKQYAAYFGLTPKLDESGSRRRLGHISKQGPSVVRWLIVESAWRVVNYSPALSFDPAGRPFTYEENMSNPAVFLEFSGAQKFSGWIFKRLPRTWQLPDGNRVEFLDYWGVQYTGMQVRKDPGVWIVYLGCLTMAVGLYITFFMSHRRIWVNVSEDKGGVKVLIAASAHRNKAAFERTIEKLTGMITVKDFQKATERVYRSKDAASHVNVMVLTSPGPEKQTAD